MPRRAASGFPAVRGVPVIAAVLLLVTFLLSLMSLTGFPPTWEDEGYYGMLGEGLARAGWCPEDQFLDADPFGDGDGCRSRIMASVFGYVGRVAGHSLATARAVAMAFSWAAILLWIPLGRRIGVDGFVAALLFAVTERVFWASHVLRPEPGLMLVTTAFLLLLAAEGERPPGAAYGWTRGLLGGAFLAAHGNGLVAAVLNGADFVIGPWRRGVRRGRRWLLLAFVGGGLAGLLLFWVVQVAPVGGWRVFGEQLGYFTHYTGGTGPLDLVRSEIGRRWRTELLVVGASDGAKVLRAGYYALTLAVAAWSAVRLSGTARRFGLLTLGSVAGYTFLVRDKVDVHIAGMVPFFTASTLAWAAAVSAKGWRWRPRAAVAAAVAVGLALSWHHAIAYPSFRDVPQAAGRTAERALEVLARRRDQGLPDVVRVVGPTQLWFWLHGAVPFSPTRHVEETDFGDGPVLLIGDAVHHVGFARWSLERCGPGDRFVLATRTGP